MSSAGFAERERYARSSGPATDGVGAAFLSFAGEGLSLASMSPMRWQYKRVDLDIADLAESSFERQLNQLGDDGWELVTAVQHARHGYSHEVHLVFKRAALEAQDLAAE